MWFRRYLFAMFLLCLPVLAVAGSPMDECMLTQLGLADDTVTVGEVRQYCQAQQALNFKVLENEKPQLETVKTMGSEQASDITLGDDSITTRDGSALSRRVFLEKTQALNPFALVPHKPNYIIIANNMAKANEAPFEQDDPGRDYSFDPWETKFQISLKMFPGLSTQMTWSYLIMKMNKWS